MKARSVVAAATSVLILTMGLSACGGSSNSSADNKQPAAEKQVDKPADLSGTWKQTNGEKDHYQEATITGNTIEINWISPGTKSLYWTGSYTAPTKSGDFSWTSQGDKDKMRESLLASSDDTKEFKYSNGEITYSASALGTTTTIHLKKQ
ncbi:hypothetical protein KIMH_05140 [Bombiscardovia apis]|uniref:Lipoprotein n=1 Tax=Bombiscardovia apis TaxID=2932182 RepID=A0ABM8BBU9_9BIFI|nr:hypothetical protein [Bombiscardovia apis]BDR54403.1 hypothetical protein KIMH_05140 [Bombiscardovia apis]